MNAQAEVLAVEERIVHVRNHERMMWTLCGFSIAQANDAWPRGHIYVDRAQFETLEISGQVCEKCLPYTSSLRNPATP